MNRARLTFSCEGDRPVGVLHLPELPPVAAIVTTGPLTSVKEQATGAYARALAERGFAVLAFDHRSFGESDGQPRQFEHPERKAADVRAAVTALVADERTRNLAVAAVGVCAGGGYMARAVADDPRICAFASVAGYSPTPLGSPGQRPRSTGPPSSGGSLPSGVGRRVRSRPSLRSGTTVVTLRCHYARHTSSMARHEGRRQLPQCLRRPVARLHDAVRRPKGRVAHPGPDPARPLRNALSPPLARKFYAAVTTPKAELWLQSRGQIDFYDDPRLIEPAADAITDHLATIVS